MQNFPKESSALISVTEMNKQVRIASFPIAAISGSIVFFFPELFEGKVRTTATKSAA